MTKPPKRPRDPNQLAKHIVDLATGEAAEQPAPSASKALGGAKGGAARAKVLSPEQRKLIAEKAASARWGNKR